jgi:hypothetical protein
MADQRDSRELDREAEREGQALALLRRHSLKFGHGKPAVRRYKDEALANGQRPAVHARNKT